MVKYENFERWYEEPESYGLRSERFHDSVSQFLSVQGKHANMELWLRAAFEAGRESLRACRSPYCECSVDKCQHPGCYDARGK